MRQNDEPDKLVDEAALRFAELLVLSLDEGGISNAVIKDDNEKKAKSG